jgi:hypothetical protein
VSRRRAPWVALFPLALAACSGEESSPAALDEMPGVTLDVTVELDPPREPFKVDGRMEALYELAPPFAGESVIGSVVLPAGEVRATTPVRFPTQPGRLRLREITVSPVPFLCGDAGLIDPRVDRAVRIGVRLCIP